MAAHLNLFVRFQSIIVSADVELNSLDNDRSRILLGCALVDQCLTLTLEAFLADCDETRKLLDPMKNGGLSTFPAKVNSCVALGLLPQDEGQLCRHLATIRNSYAHQIEATFSPKYVRLLETIENGLRLPLPRPGSLGERYRDACGALASWIALRWSPDRLESQRVILPSMWNSAP